MKFQLTIGRQGLLLITIPLIFEIIFVAVLWTILRQVDTERKELVRSREFVTEVMGLTKNMLDAGICLGAWKTTRSDEFSRQFDAIIASLPQVYGRLDELSAGDARRQKHVDVLKADGKQVLELTSGFRRPSGMAMLILMDPTVYRRRLSQAYGGFMSETTAIANEERERQNLNPANEERVQTLLGCTLLVFVTLSIFISCLMARFFSERITTRLAVLTDNCRRFVARQNLNRPIFGGDEIANLDSHIHEMARKVRSAEQKRDEYVQMVNHDLRSPLAAIQTVLAGTLRGLYGELTEKGKTRISDAGADASRLVDLINEVMEVDSLESGQFQLNRESFNMSDLIASVIASLRPLMEQKQIKLEFAPVETPVQADRARLYRVIANFLDNAIKYSPSDSTIEIGINSSPGRVEVEVKDEGPGIKSGDNERIFAAYDRGTDAKSLEKPGKGLGLAICKAIIEAHGGHIGVKSRGERGSVFWFAIPSGPRQDGESA